MLDLARIRAFLFDMDGVLYRGKQILPGVREIIELLDQRGISYACITNNATKTQEQYGKKLAAMGLSIPATHVITSAMVTGHYLRANYPRGTTAYVVGMDGLHYALFGDGHFVYTEQRPDLVVQSADFELTYAKLRIACLGIRAGARYIVTNPDRSFPSEEGLTPGSGAITAALQAAADVEPFIVGKPQPTMFRVAMELINGTPETTLVIGDRLDTDVAGAHAAGMYGALVLTGVSTREHLTGSPRQPDAVFDDLTRLIAALNDA